jgi:hypothetical protein
MVNWHSKWSIVKNETSEQTIIFINQFLNMALVERRSADQTGSPQVNGPCVEHYRFDFQQGQTLLYPPAGPNEFRVLSSSVDYPFHRYSGRNVKLATCNNLMLKITARRLFAFTSDTRLRGLLVTRTDSSTVVDSRAGL